MTVVYNEAKVSPCPLRFHFAAGGGWDVGATAACLVSAAICAAHGPLRLAVLGVQASLLLASYSQRARAQSGAVAAMIADDV
jgi:hypothetical protein